MVAWEMADNQTLTSGQVPGPMGAVGGSLSNLYGRQDETGHSLMGPKGIATQPQPVPMNNPPAGVPAKEFFEQSPMDSHAVIMLVPPDIPELIVPVKHAAPGQVEQGNISSCPLAGYLC